MPQLLRHFLCLLFVGEWVRLKVEDTHPNINHKEKGVWSININYFGPKVYHALVQALIYLLQRDGILHLYIPVKWNGKCYVQGTF